MVQDKQIVVLVIASMLGAALFSQQSSNNVLGSEKSPYESGYDHGCDDAGISNPADRYINQPEKGPAFHTNEFLQGYEDGFYACGGTPEDEPYYFEPEPDFDQDFSQPGQTRQGGTYWWGVCNNPIVDAVITEPCSTLVTPDGYALTSEGERVLFCVVGGAALYLVDPAAGEMARQLGPSVGCG